MLAPRARGSLIGLLLVACGGGAARAPDAAGADTDASSPAVDARATSDAPLALDAPSGRTPWAFPVGGPGEEQTTGLALDADGGGAVVGWFTGTIVVGGSTLISSARADAVVVRFDADGAVRWARQLDGGESYPTGVALTPAGDVVVTGYTYGASLALGPGPLDSLGSCDAFLAELSGTDGAARWGRRVGGGGCDQARALAVGADGQIVIAGTFAGTADLGGTSLTSTGGSDLFLAAYDAAGVLAWARRFGSDDADLALFVALAVSPTGSIALACSDDAVDLGAGVLTAAPGGGVGVDVSIAAYDADGEHVWSRAFDSTGNDYVRGMAWGGAGALYLAGAAYGASQGLGGTPVPAGVGGGYDAVVTRLDAAGVPVWSKVIGGASDDQARDVLVDPAGQVVVVGWVSGGADLGGGPIAAGGGGFAATYAPDGSHVASRTIPGTTLEGVARSSAGRLVVAGQFGGEVALDDLTVTSAGGPDFFVFAP